VLSAGAVAARQRELEGPTILDWFEQATTRSSMPSQSLSDDRDTTGAFGTSLHCLLLRVTRTPWSWFEVAAPIRAGQAEKANGTFRETAATPNLGEMVWWAYFAAVP